MFGLSGTPVANDRWIVTVNGTQYSVTVGASSVQAGNTLIPIAGGAANTLDQIGRALAQAINATAPAGFTAFADGAQLFVAERSGIAFDASAVVALDTPPTGGSLAASANGAAIVAELNGDPVPGETWRLTIGSQNYDVKVGDTLTLGGQPVTVATRADIARALASAVNSTVAGTIVATQVGDTLVLIDNAGGAFTAQLAVLTSGPAGTVVVTAADAVVTIGGTPQAGQTWTVVLNGTTSVTVAFNEVVNGVTVNTLAKLGAALTFKIDQLSAFSATVGVSPPVGTAVINVHATGGSFANSAATVAGLSGSAGVVARSSATATLSGAPQPGELWTVTVNGNVTSLTVNPTTPETLAQVAAALAAQINGLTNFVATVTASGTGILIVSATAATVTASASVTRRAARAR